jgi:hypothetical protein
MGHSQIGCHKVSDTTAPWVMLTLSLSWNAPSISSLIMLMEDGGNPLALWSKGASA